MECVKDYVPPDPRLSHQSSSSLGSVAQPYLAIPSAVTHEMAVGEHP